MRVRVVFFASLREAAATAGVEVDLAPTATLGDVLPALAGLLGGAALAAIGAADVRIAVNHALVDGRATPLKAGDEVAFLPPVTGG